MVEGRGVPEMFYPGVGRQAAFARLATALALVSAGGLAVGAVAVGRLAVRSLGIKQGRIERLAIEDLQVGRLHVRELVTEVKL